jgi:hypothetical protein
MKNKLKSLALLFVLGSLSLTSCSNDDNTGESTLEVTSNVVATVTPVTSTLSFTATNTVAEANENEFEYKVTLSAAQSKDIHFQVSQIAGTATEDADFTFDHEIVIPAYSTMGTAKIKILKDRTKEVTETLTLQIGDIKTANASLVAKTVSFSITNYVSTFLDLSFAFNRSFNVGFNNPWVATLPSSGTVYNLCQVAYDMDFYLLDSSFNDTGNAQAGTSACVEKMSLNGATLANGTYYVVYDIYGDAGLSTIDHDPFFIPITVTYGKAGAINDAVFEQESDYYATSLDGTGSNYVIQFTLLNGIFTVQNSLNTTLATGRSANVIKDAISTARSLKIKN